MIIIFSFQYKLTKIQRSSPTALHFITTAFLLIATMTLTELTPSKILKPRSQYRHPTEQGLLEHIISKLNTRQPHDSIKLSLKSSLRKTPILQEIS